MCLPSRWPRKSDRRGQKVAVLPRRYASVHLSTWWPSREFSHCQTDLALAFATRADQRMLSVACPMDDRRSSLLPVLPDAMLLDVRRVNWRLERSPVVGMTNVPLRSFYPALRLAPRTTRRLHKYIHPSWTAGQAAMGLPRSCRRSSWRSKITSRRSVGVVGRVGCTKRRRHCFRLA